MLRRRGVHTAGTDHQGTDVPRSPFLGWFMLRWALSWLVLCAVALGQEPGPAEDVIRLPVVNTVTVEPAPVVPPAVVSKLPADYVFVVESDKQLVPPVSSPDGIVTCQEDEGPVRIRAKFAGGSGAVESRVFKSKWVYTFEPVASGRVELILTPYGITPETVHEQKRVTLDVVGLLPIPPPVVPVDPVKPPVDPPVPPPVDPTPTTFTGPIQVLIVENANEKRNLPPAQLNAMLSAAVRSYCFSHCKKTNGQIDFRIIDANADVSRAEKWIQDAMKEPRSGLPWLLVRNEKTGASIPLPEDTERLLSVLKQYGGP